jgi:hypothetical protein
MLALRLRNGATIEIPAIGIIEQPFRPCLTFSMDECPRWEACCHELTKVSTARLLPITPFWHSGALTNGV